MVLTTIHRCKHCLKLFKMECRINLCSWYGTLFGISTLTFLTISGTYLFTNNQNLFANQVNQIVWGISNQEKIITKLTEYQIVTPRQDQKGKFGQDKDG